MYVWFLSFEGGGGSARAPLDLRLGMKVCEAIVTHINRFIRMESHYYNSYYFQYRILTCWLNLKKLLFMFLEVFKEQVCSRAQTTLDKMLSCSQYQMKVNFFITGSLLNRILPCVANEAKLICHFQIKRRLVDLEINTYIQYSI